MKSFFSIRNPRVIKLSVLMIVMLALAMISLQPAFVAPAQAQTTWNLVWSDEFSGSSVNTANWTFETGGGGWGNNELEYYTNGQNASVANGILTITASKGSGGYSCWYGTCQYTSTRMNTNGKKSWTYGKVEARIAIPTGQGTWPAFWMLGTDIGSVGWPKSGEIDIMEHINNENITHGTIHWDSNGHVSYGCPSGAISGLTGYHLYTITWDTNAITWFVDNVQYCQANIANNINSTEEFHLPFFIILNLAVGGAWPGNPDASTVFPAKMMVDYVRVYQAGSGGGGGSINSSAWYNVINQNSNKCVDDANWGTTNGSVVQQWTCGSQQYNQEWQFQPTDSGYYKVTTRQAQGLVWDVANVGTANGSKIHLWGYGGGANQQWMPVSMGSGYYKFVARNSGRCLDVPSASTADGVQLQIYDCNGTPAQSFRLAQQP